MSRTVRIAALALLAVLALSLAAAGLPPATVTPSDGGVGEGTGSGVGQGSGDGAGDAGGFERPEWIAPLVAATFALLRVLGILAVALLVAALVYLTVTRREAVLTAIRGLLARIPSAVAQVAAVALFALALLWVWDGGGFPRSAPIVPFVGQGGGESSEATTTISPDQTLVLLVLLGLAALAALGLWWWYSRGRSGSGDEDERGETERTADSTPEQTEEPTRSPGAVDTPAHPVVDAWREMARIAGVPNPGTATPGQVADSAAAAGFDREDVALLTRLFEDVRYGAREVSERETERALRAFREIEHTEDDGAQT